MPLFIGRSAEQGLFYQWVSSEPQDGRRIALLIGYPGSGKSSLLARLEQLALDHEPERWFIQRVELNASETASQFLERLLAETYRLLRGKLVRKGPRDARLLQSLLKAVPSVGGLLAELVQEDPRPGWIRFIDYCVAISSALEKADDRLILLVDPDREMNQQQPEDWLSLAKRIPSRLRIVIAQRPTDSVASHPEARMAFARIPPQGYLEDLDESSVMDWYQQEMQSGRLAEVAASWTDVTRRELPRRAYDRLKGFAFAHDSAIRHLANEGRESPLDCVTTVPGDVQDLLDWQFEYLARQGSDRLRAALALQTFTVPIPGELVARAARIKVDKLIAELSDPRYLTFFRKVDDCYAPFHPLFGERLERELSRNPALALELAENAWNVLEPRLRSQPPDRLLAETFELLGATAVAARFPDVERLKSAVNLTGDAKLRLNLLDAYEADLRLVLERASDDALTIATYLNALGGVYERRGDPARAEQMYQQAWGVGGADIQLPRTQTFDLYRRIGDLRRQAAEACRRLSSIYRKAGRVEEAEQLALRAFGYSGHGQNLNDFVRRFGEQGIELARAGDLDGAELALRSALAAVRQFGGSAADFETTCANLATIYIEKRRFNDAERVLQEGLQSARARRSTTTEAGLLYNLGVVFDRRGNSESARANWERALTIYGELNDKDGAARLEACLAGLS